MSNIGRVTMSRGCFLQLVTFAAALVSARASQDPVETSVGIAGEPNAVITGELDKPLLVRCLAYGYPEPSVFWYRGLSGPMVPYSSSLYEVRRNSLLIRRLTVETLGEYACQAYNGIGRPALWSVVVRAYRSEDIPSEQERHSFNGPQTELTTTTTNTPEFPVYTVPVSTHISVPETTITAGTQLSILCEVEGYPDADVYWTKDAARLVPSDRVIITGTIVSRLTISSSSMEDAGAYTCHASNAYSAHQSTVQIAVQSMTIPSKCTDNPFFANCHLIVRSKFCQHKYYSKFCCKSCMEAGQLNPSEFDMQADQSWAVKK